jgi:hypothetical protein
MNKAVKIGLIVLAISAVTATGILYKRNKKYGNKTAQVALPSGETIKVSPEAAAIIAEAQKWVGVKEIGDNQGWENKELETKMKTNGGWWKGAPYCACFVKMVIVSVATGKAKEFFKKTLTAAAINTWQKLQNTEYSEKIDKPEPGCILCYKNHNEICESTTGDKNTVISGNSPLGSTPKPDGIVRRTRGAGLGLGDDPFLGYIRIKKLS